MSITTYARQLPTNTSQVISKSDILIGKDVLELLTGAMYVDPLSIFREYVQNATDAIEEARRVGLLGSESGRIDVHIDLSNRLIHLRDNGASIPHPEFISRLLSIGSSNKRGQHLRGFRGIGRLAGLAYCQEVVFRGRSCATEAVTEVTFNARKLRELINSNDTEHDLQTAVSEIAAVTRSSGTFPHRFFEVELRRLIRIKNDVLLNTEAVERYLSQVAPVSFRKDFKYSDEIDQFLIQHGVEKPVELVINGNIAVQRPHRTRFELRSNITDAFSGIEFHKIPGVDGGVDAVGWILDHCYLGALPRSLNTGGLRLRSGNIQIGESDIAAALFNEPRFNSWCVGEFHIINDRILPNGRRDEFEYSSAYVNLQSHMSKIAGDISKICRTRSSVRNLIRVINNHLTKIDKDFGVLRAIPHMFPFREKHQKTLQESIQKQAVVVKNKLPAGTDKDALINRVNELAHKFDRITSLKTKDGILMRLTPAKKRAYSEVLSALYEVTNDVSVAHHYVNKIMKRIRRK